MYNAYITRIKNVHKHPNADRLQIGECFGNAVIVSMEYENNQLGVYFPSDGQLSVEFADANNLLRKKDENGNNIGGYMDPEKRNVTAIKLRGEKSDGLFLPLRSLEYFGDISELRDGDRIDNFNGHEICCKYVPRKQNRRGHYSEGNKTRKKKVNVSPLFVEHADTEQLAYNLAAFKPGDEIEITLKMHGTSQRTGYLPVFKGYKNDFWGRIVKVVNPDKPMGKLARKFYEKALNHVTPIYDWGYVSGTRRTVLENFEGGYYGSNEFREAHSKFFEGKLNKGEEIFYEVVGFTHTGTPIMASGDNKKLQDKEFVKKYGDTTVFSYGCLPNGLSRGEVWKEIYTDPYGERTFIDKPQSDIYVYRMTMTNQDGFVVEYTPDFMRYRCEQMGVKCVPVFDQFNIPAKNKKPGEYVLERAEKYYDGPDPIGKTHIREGVVVRIINRPKFCAYKHKNWYFKALEGIVKVEAETPDMEEAESVANDTE